MIFARKCRWGFTLIELLVVIAIIALLLSIIIPVLGVSKERARRLVCSTGIKQFFVGIMLYADNYENKLPNGLSEASTDEHTPVLSRNVGDELADLLDGHETMKCPWLDEPFDGDEWWYYSGYGYVLGYNYLGGHGGTPWNIAAAGGKQWESPQKSSDRSSLKVVTELNFWVPGDRTFAPHGARGPINEFHKSGFGGMTPMEAGAKGGNIGLLDGSISWEKIEDMNVYRGSRMHQCYSNW